ncbi:GDSL-type esterase/lipase family protein [Mucilaginibacter sp. AK015]|uniref:GDSL-type esterase/lipase family protein n=1 Tax=Mucilaginibacter sp. AK015 TaxID=2723072 RepID=UPI001613A157|nr:GDSL-type esterase/lipase family protein [Mucilaginibacter sp. AK015]MBB5395815.1 lysophospholipase L1-like esterase [Mucilaginibacter sp. AK015]
MKLKLYLFFILLTAGITANAQTGFPFDNEIRDFKHQDSISMPAKNGILFIGSSSIRKWTDLEQRFSDKPIIRRGVGGCTIEQVVDYYAPYIIYPYQPRKIFIYAGENDIAAGKTGKFTAREFYKLWAMIKQNLPHAEIYFMAIKPSPSRAKYFPEVKIANALVRSFLKNKKKGHYVDIASVILNPATHQPDTSLFESDMLHLNSKGYDKWQAVLQPLVK